jgi:hypothetical protein
MDDRSETISLGEPSNTSTGVACVIAASMLSGVSAALTQKVQRSIDSYLNEILKVLSGEGKQRNSFFLSGELAMFGIVFLLLQQLLQHMINPSFTEVWCIIITSSDRLS